MGNSNESQIRMWATLLSLSMQAISSHHILMTNSMWAIVQFCLLSSFIICHPLANSMWVTLHYFSLCNVVSSHFMSWLTGGEWYSSFDGQNLSHLIPCPTDSEWHPLYNQVLQLIIPNDSMWVVLHFFLSMQSQHLLSQPEIGVGGTTSFHSWSHITWHTSLWVAQPFFVAILLSWCPLTNWHCHIYCFWAPTSSNLISWPTAGE